MATESNQDDRAQGSNGWTLILISIGVGLIACCILIPQSDDNARLHYQCEKLRIDLEHLDRQSAANEEFVRRIGDDPVLAERLAQRQMKFVRQGSSVLDIEGPRGPMDRSPFALVAVAPPQPLAPLELRGGKLADLTRNPKSRLYTIGTGLLLLAVGLVLGSSPSKR
jgi:hypothetical protein